MEFDPCSHDIAARREQPADVIEIAPLLHVQHAVSAQRDDLLDSIGSGNANRTQTTEFTGILASLVL